MALLKVICWAIIFITKIRYQKTPARVFRFLVNAEQAGKRSYNLYIVCILF